MCKLFSAQSSQKGQTRAEIQSYFVHCAVSHAQGWKGCQRAQSSVYTRHRVRPAAFLVADIQNWRDVYVEVYVVSFSW